MAKPVLSGEISSDGVLELLGTIEAQRTSGMLQFEAPAGAGSVDLVAGQLALEQTPLPDGSDPVDVFLALREGRYEVFQRLPPLPVSKGDERHRAGSLAVHIPADLMNYCERAGLTGTLTLDREGRWAEALYDRGALVAIQVDGAEDADLHDVFGWEEGTFRIAALDEAPVEIQDGSGHPEDENDAGDREETRRWVGRRRGDETGRQFLRVVEVALSSILEERERRRSPSRSSPPLPPAPKARAPERPVAPAAETPEESSGRREPTVKVIYLAPREDGEPPTSGGDPTKHVSGSNAKEIDLPDAVPTRRSPGASQSIGSLIGVTCFWMVFAIVVFGAVLVLLAHLPPVG